MENLVVPKPSASQRSFEEPAPVQRPRFPQSLLENEESRFVDPRKEATLMLPENSVSFIPIQIALEAQSMQTEQTIVRKDVFQSLYRMLTGWFAALKTRMSKRARRRARLTKGGQRALDQLRYLSLLCDASEHRSPEEILSAEAAFGEAYYEILNLSSNLERMAQKEDDHHVQRYSRHMASLLRSTP